MRDKNWQVTISQVAKESGVSSQTVSRVINNRQEITPETRQHVQEVIKRLGYQPNAIARSLSQRRSHTLGVVTSGLEYYGPSHILVGVEQGANREGLYPFQPITSAGKREHWTHCKWSHVAPSGGDYLDRT